MGFPEVMLPFPKTYPQFKLNHLQTLGDSSLFTQTNTENIITVSLARTLTEADTANRVLLMTTLVANRGNIDQGHTVILVDVPTTTTPAPFAAPAFMQDLYVGSLDVDRKLTLNSLIITAETYDASIRLTIEGGL